MDKEILRQYMSILKETQEEECRILELQKEIDSLSPEVREVSDVVTKGKRGKKSLGVCKLHGFEDHKKLNQKRAKLRERKAKKELHISQLDSLVIEAEEYIYSLPESEIRRILLYFCIDRKSWSETAKAMGEGYTAEACKQKFSRFMRVK